MSTITTSDLQAATNTQLAQGAASPAESRATDMITSADDGDGGSRSGSTFPDGEVVEPNSGARNHQSPSETCAWRILAGVSGFMAVMSLALLIGGLLNHDGIHPIWATVCFWSSSFFVFANRQLAHTTAAAVNEQLGRADATRALDQASRQALLTYFVFNPSEDKQEGHGSSSDAAERGEGRGYGRGESVMEAGDSMDKRDTTPCSRMSCPSLDTPIVAAEATAVTLGTHADATSATPTPDDLEAQLTPVLTYSVEDGTTNAEGPGVSTRPGSMDKGPARMGSGKWGTNGTCIICLGEYKNGDRLCRMPCRHIYHATCIDEWLDRAKQPSCPLCKKDLRGEVPAASTTVARPS